MISQKRANAVRNLVSLYTVVIGVALSLAVVGLFEAGHGLDSVTPSSAILFIAFVITLIPFYHGALRHLDDAYLESDAADIKDHALIFDFLLLFFHAVAFVFLSLLMREPVEFAYVLLVVLVIDVLWGLLTHFVAPAAQKSGAEGRWALINLLFVGLSIVLLVSFDVGDGVDDVKMAVSVAFMCVARTVVDYYWCYHFYFPR